jgi:predicted nucleic acid-binding Zn ribbon protein
LHWESGIVVRARGCGEASAVCVRDVIAAAAVFAIADDAALTCPRAEVLLPRVSSASGFALAGFERFFVEDAALACKIAEALLPEMYSTAGSIAGPRSTLDRAVELADDAALACQQAEALLPGRSSTGADAI